MRVPRWAMAVGVAGFIAALAILAASSPDRARAADCPGRVISSAGHRASAYWLGESFKGLAISECEQSSVPRGRGFAPALSLIYGDCTPEPGEDGGCAPPLEIQETSVCGIDPLTYDILPLSRSVSRGALLARYNNGFTDVYTGTTNVRITNGGVTSMTRKVAALRPVGGPLTHGRLPMPRFPESTMRTLRRVRTLYRKLGSTRRVRSRLHISRRAVRDRLDLLHDIEALARSRHEKVRTLHC